jgi:hypothetical protein
MKNGIAKTEFYHSTTVRLTQSLSTKRFGMADCAGIPQQFALPKAFQLNAAHLVGFFASRLFTKASFRHSLKTKKPLTFVRGFVARPGFEPGTSGL